MRIHRDPAPSQINVVGERVERTKRRGDTQNTDDVGGWAVAELVMSPWAAAVLRVTQPAKSASITSRGSTHRDQPALATMVAEVVAAMNVVSAPTESYEYSKERTSL